MASPLLDVSTHWSVVEVLDRGCNKVPDLLIHQTVFRLTVYDVFTGGTGTETSWEVRLTRACGEKNRITTSSAGTWRSMSLPL